MSTETKFKEWINSLTQQEKSDLISNNKQIYTLSIAMGSRYFDIRKDKKMRNENHTCLESVEFNYCYSESFTEISQEYIDKILSRMYIL